MSDSPAAPGYRTENADAPPQQCRPLAAAWQWDQSGQCFDLVTLFLASSPINILSDLAILILPLPIITGLRIERKEKIGLVLAFLCGVFVAIVDVGEWWSIAPIPTARVFRLGDSSWLCAARSEPMSTPPSHRLARLVCR